MLDLAGSGEYSPAPTSTGTPAEANSSADDGSEMLYQFLPWTTPLSSARLSGAVSHGWRRNPLRSVVPNITIKESRRLTSDARYFITTCRFLAAQRLSLKQLGVRCIIFSYVFLFEQVIFSTMPSRFVCHRIGSFLSVVVDISACCPQACLLNLRSGVSSMILVLNVKLSCSG